MTSTRIIFLILTAFLLISCSKKEASPKDNLPLYTQQLLSIAYGCTCDLAENPAILCNCRDDSWDKDIKIVCKTNPTDLSKALDTCFATYQKKTG